MRFATLEAWLRWQERLHPRAIDLGLERVASVWRRLDAPLEGTTVITVAGTNGKGSTVALLEAILMQAGLSTGSYTSPHLVRYNERIRLDGEPVADEALLEAFDAVDRARGKTALTYFEFGTLAALWILSRQRVEAALLEVGLGGRLDAVNLLDADLALVTSIGLDHQEWLGGDREAIGREKAGIFRPGRPAVFSAPDMPASVGEAAAVLGTPLHRNGVHFHLAEQEAGWSWWSGSRRFDDLPPPALPGRHQLDNAAGVLMALRLLEERLPVDEPAIRRGLRQVALPGRLQRIRRGGVTWILDVAHNPQAVEALAGALEARPRSGRTLALFGMFRDKDAAAAIRLLEPLVDEWHYVSLRGERGRPAARLAEIRPGRIHDSVAEGLRAVEARARPGDRVVVFGSFRVVEQALPLLEAGDPLPQPGFPV